MARKAVNAGIRPPGNNPEGTLAAADVLYCMGLAGKFGMWRELRKLSEDGKVLQPRHTIGGRDESDMCQYHRE